jgi:hypothetical protein
MADSFMETFKTETLPTYLTTARLLASRLAWSARQRG